MVKLCLQNNSHKVSETLKYTQTEGFLHYLFCKIGGVKALKKKIKLALYWQSNLSHNGSLTLSSHSELCTNKKDCTLFARLPAFAVKYKARKQKREKMYVYLLFCVRDLMRFLLSLYSSQPGKVVQLQLLP